MSAPQPQSSTFVGSLHTPVVSSRFLTTRRTEPASLFGLFGESQQPPEVPLRLMISHMLREVQTPERTRSQTSPIAAPLLQSPLNLPSLQPSHPPRSPRAIPAPHILQGESRATHSPFVIHRNPNILHQLHPQSRALASPPQSLPILLDPSEFSFHNTSHVQ